MGQYIQEGIEAKRLLQMENKELMESHGRGYNSPAESQQKHKMWHEFKTAD